MRQAPRTDSAGKPLEAVDRAREQIAAALGATAREIIFTSGATESNNLAIKGVAQAASRRGRHLVTTASEHKAVLDPFKRLAREGWEVTVVPCDEFGAVSPEMIARAITNQTVLVSVMAANNEVGTLNPIEEIGSLCQSAASFFTPTPPRPSARCRSLWNRAQSTC